MDIPWMFLLLFPFLPLSDLPPIGHFLVEAKSGSRLQPAMTGSRGHGLIPILVHFGRGGQNANGPQGPQSQKVLRKAPLVILLGASGPVQSLTWPVDWGESVFINAERVCGSQLWLGFSWRLQVSLLSTL
ncbi:uncharacterized protein ACLA_079850 [Aspergillus clavatus NRRL 1]|uniref:Uncharacterized protein n=1 Tax=Aspergillus clavatus (strain ATCC 1007 / CBS 513.65 / DSM 816 / NCTC 3887 / NRRL 1 / QM 1276 / 107) TaxID=344612 RepID=A1CSL4_ASPCL|nr:uncharacterized protein ACLA_079850 [Aspergillus clavatus NRRL 1]EAW06301.1 hypothetical protein ACLA_079850 [Aspergillus clavatus NRRL 1]